MKNGDLSVMGDYVYAVSGAKPFVILLMFVFFGVSRAECLPRPVTPEGIVGILSGNSPITLSEARQLPPECVLLFAHRGCGVEWYASLDKHKLDVRGHPFYSKLAGSSQSGGVPWAASYHHACWGEVARARSYSAKTKHERQRYLQGFRGNYEFVVKHPEWLPKNWAYLADMYVKLGQGEEALGNDKDAVVAYLEAKKIKRDLPDVYIGLAKLMRKSSDKKGLLDLLSEGVLHNKGNKTLSRMYLENGGGLLPEMDEGVGIGVAAKEVSGSEARDGVGLAQNNDGAARVDPVVSGEGHKKDGFAGDVAGEGAGVNVPAGKYCRFCP